MVGEVLSIFDTTDSIRWNIVLGPVSESNTEAIERWVRVYCEDSVRFMTELRNWSKSGKPINRPQSAADKKSIPDIINLFDKIKEQLKISSFPTIIINDRLLSSLYTPGDLKYIVSDFNLTTYNANTSA